MFQLVKIKWLGRIESIKYLLDKIQLDNDTQSYTVLHTVTQLPVEDSPPGLDLREEEEAGNESQRESLHCTC